MERAAKGMRLWALAPVALLPVSPGMAMGAGALLALWRPGWLEDLKRLQKPALQVAVVLLGFGMDASEVFRAARDGLWLSLATLGLCFAAGMSIAFGIGVPARIAALVCAGTGICGGSAIAAAGASMDADREEMGIALGVVFLLNAVGVYLFPWLGGLLHLDPVVFGAWSGLALHDLSSVVAASSQVGAPALAAALSTKLARTLWIVPVALALGAVFDRRGGRFDWKRSVPWFLFGFFGAALARSFWNPVATWAAPAGVAARHLMAVALFLVGNSLTVEAVRKAGVKTLAMGVALWVLVAGGSLGWLLRG